MPHFLPQPRMDISIYAPSNSFKSLVSANTCIEIIVHDKCSSAHIMFCPSLQCTVCVLVWRSDKILLLSETGESALESFRIVWKVEKVKYVCPSIANPWHWQRPFLWRNQIPAPEHWKKDSDIHISEKRNISLNRQSAKHGWSFFLLQAVLICTPMIVWWSWSK